MASPDHLQSCTPARTIPLDVLPDLPPRPDGVAKSQNARRRGIVLASIQVLILAHIGLWLLSREFNWFDGKTLAPVEPSEAMQTLEWGYINAGFILFALALLSTLIFGRFFCGWGCHIIMLQDFCGWIMKKCGVRPKPFRSRVLIWVPLGVALYMFVWPTFKRLAVFPLLNRWWPDARVWLRPVADWQGFSNHLTTTEFWTNTETGVSFPILMAVPTLLVVGFAAVYFLGAKGFCTYGCPYGGFFAPLDEWAPGRIRVTDDCEQCGHCTATCTSNVRVHEEVREFGMVVDPGCMKCMDCVSVCPNDALYFGFGRPAVKKGTPRDKGVMRSFDLSFSEDLALGGLFLLLLLGWRGMYLFERVPFLMAVGLAGIGAFVTFKAWRMLDRRRELVSLQNVRLKSRGRLTRIGWIFASITIAFTAISVQGLLVNWHGWRAGVVQRAEIGVGWKAGEYREAALSPDNESLIPAADRRAAGKAIDHLRRTRGLGDGGLAIMTDPAVYADLAWLHVVRGEWRAAEGELAAYLSAVGERDFICADRMRLMLLDNRPRDAVAYGRDVVSDHPTFSETVRLLRVLEGAAGG